MNIEVRRSCSGDFEQIVSLLRQLWTDKKVDPNFLLPIFKKALVSDSKIYLVATNVNQVIGFGSLTLKDDLWPEGQVAYLDELVIDDRHRNKGIGAQLLERLIFIAKQKGCYRIELTSAFYRKESHRFYERHGFASRAYVFSKIL